MRTTNASVFLIEYYDYATKLPQKKQHYDSHIMIFKKNNEKKKILGQKQSFMKRINVT